MNVVWLFPILLFAGPDAPVPTANPEWQRLLDEILTRAEAERDRNDEPARAPEPDAAPQPVAPLVLDFVRYFSTTGARRFPSSRDRLANYESMIEAVLARHGLPAALKWIGLVESAYDPAARSPMNAVGLWQLMPETARAFGLRIDGPDERLDPVKSTGAAARYLAFLYARFRDWPLVLAAYNAGERRVRDAIQRAGTAEFRQVARSGLLPRETRAYVPAVLAAQRLGEADHDPRAFSNGGTTTDTLRRAAGGVVFATFSPTR